MNVLLKAMLKEVMDLVQVGKAALAKNYSGVLTALIGAGEDVPVLVANFSSLKPELEALLVNPAADADLLAYALSLVGGESAQAQAVIAASADLILSTVGKAVVLYHAIEAAKAPVAAPAIPPAAPSA